MLLFASRPFFSWDTQHKKKRETNIKNETIRVYTRKYVLCREMESPSGRLGGFGKLWVLFFHTPLLEGYAHFSHPRNPCASDKSPKPPIGSTALLWGSSLLTDSQVVPGFLTAQMSSKVVLQQKQLLVLYPAAACG